VHDKPPDPPFPPFLQYQLKTLGDPRNNSGKNPWDQAFAHLKVLEIDTAGVQQKACPDTFIAGRMGEGSDGLGAVT
jgi:hypothetical protein